MAVLYRKYRPQTFAEVVGQKHVTTTLQNAIAKSAVAHAYLFTGSRGVGKTSLARILAKAVNCLQRSGPEACNNCSVCTAISQNAFLDLVEIDAASNTGVENVRELIEHVRFQPSLGTYKIFIIDEVHMLSKAAFNALLKTLEEPPKHVIFILATTEVHKVPATIISRTQRFDFKRLDELEIAAQLEFVIAQEKIKIPKEVVALIAARAAGGLRDALTLLDTVIGLGKNIALKDAELLLGVTNISVSQQLVSAILSGDQQAVLKLFDDFAEQSIDCVILNKDFLEYLRKLLITKISPGVNLGLLPEVAAILSRQAAQCTTSELLFIIRLFLRSYKELANTPDPELPLLLASLEAAIKKFGETSVPKSVSGGVIMPDIGQVFPNQTSARVTISIPEAQVAYADVSHDELNQWWPEVIVKVRDINSPLATLLKNSPIQEVRNGIIVLGVRYLFHKEHLESKKNIALVMDIFEQVSGKRVGLKAVLSKIAPEEVVDTAQVLSDALQVFGGELIE